MTKPVTVRVKGSGWETVIEVDSFYGDAAGVAARLRHEKIPAKKVGEEVVIVCSPT